MLSCSKGTKRLIQGRVFEGCGGVLDICVMLFPSYLVILDGDIEVNYSVSNRNSDVPPVWMEVFKGRVGTS